MKILVMAVLMSASVAVMAQAEPPAPLDFEEQRAAILEVMDVEAKLVTELRRCVEASTTEEVMRGCITTHVAALQEAMLHRFSVEHDLR